MKRYERPLKRRRRGGAPARRAATPAEAPSSVRGAEPSPPSRALTAPGLEAHLWEAANILRGSPVDRTDWKRYILPLLFCKRICDVWDEEHAAMLEEHGEDYRGGGDRLGDDLGEG